MEINVLKCLRGYCISHVSVSQYSSTPNDHTIMDCAITIANTGQGQFQVWEQLLW